MKSAHQAFEDAAADLQMAWSNVDHAMKMVEEDTQQAVAKTCEEIAADLEFMARTPAGDDHRAILLELAGTIRLRYCNASSTQSSTGI